MSEYQWYHFRAADKPLDDEALEFMRQQSTRASVSRWEFTNEYHFGNFGGDTEEMLRRGFDVYLHFANFMVRNLAFRLPVLPCSWKTFGQFAVADELEWQPDKNGVAGILWVTPEPDEYTDDYFESLELLLGRIAPAREMLIQGDLRPLYLFWLASWCDEQSAEPPVPAGLQGINDGKADDCLLAIVEFLEIDRDLLAVAVEKSPPAPKRTNTSKDIKGWLTAKSESDVRQIAQELLKDSTARARVLREIRAGSDEPVWPLENTNRTVGDMRQAAEQARKIRQKELREMARILQENQRRVEQKAREKHLKQITDDPMPFIHRIDACVKTKIRKGYAEAAANLRDFSEALGADAAVAEAARLRREFPRSPALHEELDRAGF